MLVHMFFSRYTILYPDYCICENAFAAQLLFDIIPGATAQSRCVRIYLALMASHFRAWQEGDGHVQSLVCCPWQSLIERGPLQQGETYGSWQCLVERGSLQQGETYRS